MKRIWEEIKDMWYYSKSCVIAAILLILFLIIIICCCISSENDYNIKNNYNDGVCIECGGNYKFFQAIGRGNKTYYLYKCKDCDYIIESKQYFGD